MNYKKVIIDSIVTSYPESSFDGVICRQAYECEITFEFQENFERVLTKKLSAKLYDNEMDNAENAKASFNRKKRMDVSFHLHDSDIDERQLPTYELDLLDSSGLVKWMFGENLNEIVPMTNRLVAVHECDATEAK